MGLRFAILKTINKEGNEEVILEYDEDLLKASLLAKTKETLILSAKTKFLGGYALDDILKAVSTSFDKQVLEFKSESIRIR